jgi:MFS superfamily sulfate permease-like transporter
MSPREASREVLASLVVFLVALPLCMGIAIASGVSPAMGLLSGIVGGIVVGSLAGSPLQVTGPAAGLVVIVFDVVQSHGLSGLSVVVLAAGLMQLAAGTLRLGQWFRAVAPSVLYAMLAGIGILILASQLHVMIDDAPRASGIANLLALPEAFVKGVVPLDGSPHHVAALVGILTLGTMIVWNLLRPKLPATLAVLPAPLLAVGVATLVATVMALPIAYVDVPESLGSMIRFPAFADFALLAQPAVLGTTFALAAVASAESLLSAGAVDKLHKGVRTNFDRELSAQGIGNVVLGLLGGLPVTGVIVRSSANVEAGAKTRASAVLHGIWLLATIALVPFALELVPVASLAAVLVYVGYKLVNVAVIKDLYARGRVEFGIYAVTVGVIVATSLLEGLLVGLALSIINLAWKFSRLRVDVSTGADGSVDIDLHGVATFVVLPQLARALEGVDAEAKSLSLHLEHLDYVDHACLELIKEWERQRLAGGAKVRLEWSELERRTQAPEPGGEPRAA